MYRASRHVFHVIMALVLLLPDGYAPRASQWFVSPEGTSTNEGTIDSPWDLTSAITPGKPVKGGDVIWLRRGTYRNDRSEFTARISGERNRPVIIRNYRNERATIDGAVTVDGNDLWVWGLEVLISAPRPDRPLPAGSSPPELKRPAGGFHGNRGQRTKIINCIVHDNNQGFSYWLGATDAEIYGCVIYRNGWVGVDRTHGHAIYTQNDTGTKRIVDNIMFDPYSYLLHAYGSSRAYVNGYYVEGNMFLGGPVLIGGGKPSERIAFINNYTYKAPVQFGYNAPYNYAMRCERNYFASTVSVNRYHTVVMTQNDFVATSRGDISPPKTTQSLDIQWDHNRYVDVSAARLTQWQQKTGYDRNSAVTVSPAGRPQRNLIVVRPNQYEPGRANVAVYSWEGNAAVELDLSNVLKRGQPFQVRNVQDFYGNSVAKGTYNGEKITVPLLRGSKKIELRLPGDPTQRVWHTVGDYPDCDAFVVLPVVNGREASTSAKTAIITDGTGIANEE